ncbi:hypothetical protein MKW94_011078 [Papaver nudicaule]|uniref:Uncharacterized protein n=1 Tax=Papaver nudicaule TaxID=74823 RepID=A0AA41RYC3_PAPNU|nr:hypothetical protein [Papaver nudicaule]
MLQGGSIFAQSPSFNSHSSDNFAEIAAKVCEEFVDDRVQLGLELEENDGEIVKHDDLQEEEKANEEEDDEFEFCFLSGDGITISADEIFADGKIRPVFPVFNRDLLFAGGKDYKDEEDNYEPKKKKKMSRALCVARFAPAQDRPCTNTWKLLEIWMFYHPYHRSWPYSIYF